MAEWFQNEPEAMARLAHYEVTSGIYYEALRDRVFAGYPSEDNADICLVVPFRNDQDSPIPGHFTHTGDSQVSHGLAGQWRCWYVNLRDMRQVCGVDGAHV